MDIRDPSLWMWTEARRLLDQADRLSQQFFRLPTGRAGGSWEPPADIFETDEAWWLQVALPGVPAERVRYTLSGDTFHVVADRGLPGRCSHGSIHRLEIPHGRFERSIRFPNVPLYVAHAEVRDGCLLVALRKPNW